MLKYWTQFVVLFCCDGGLIVQKVYFINHYRWLIDHIKSRFATNESFLHGRREITP